MATSSAEEAPILVVGALGRELARLKREAHPGLALLETGEGRLNAERRLEASLDRERARAVFSIGFAGALSPGLRIGDLVVATEVRGAEGRPEPMLVSTATRVTAGAPLHLAVAVTSDRILWQSAEKHALASSLGEGEIAFVDMESTSIANVCARRRLPFLIARSITDLLDEDLPLDFNKCRSEDGRVDSRKVLKAALFKPRILAGLLELRKHSELCAERMTEFVLELVQLTS